MQTVRTFRKLRGGAAGKGREGKGTVLHMKLIDAGCWEEAVGRVNLQSQNEVWGAAPGRETGMRKNKVVAPLRVYLGKRKYQSPCCLLCLGHRSAQRLGLHLPT